MHGLNETLGKQRRFCWLAKDPQLSVLYSASVATRNIIVIGGSAGGLNALRELLSLLPAGLEAATFVAIHRAYKAFDFLPSALSRRAHMEVSAAVDGQMFEFRHIYTAPPGSHLIVEPDVLRVEMKAKQLGSVDVLFKSAANTYGERVVGLLLSGMLHDGTEGCREIRKHGGITIVQDPSEADYPSMPQSAMKNVAVDYCIRIPEIARKLEEFVAGAGSPPRSQKARVMIVEDEWLLASELERQLTELGYIVVATVPSGEEALAVAASVIPDIVLMDVGLSGRMKGTEAALRLWQEFHLPIVYLTARSDQATLAAAQNSMPYGFLTKPHTVGQLHSALQLALGRRRREFKTLPFPKTSSRAS
jgi:chemotaxis response regulator CheB